jgi:hypothetical protein
MIIFYATERFILQPANKHDTLCLEERFIITERHSPTVAIGEQNENKQAYCEYCRPHINCGTLKPIILQRWRCRHWGATDSTPRSVNPSIQGNSQNKDGA